MFEQNEIPGDNPQRAKYEWLSQEVERLEKLIRDNQRKAVKLQADTVKTINTLVKTMQTSMNSQRPRNQQEMSKK